MHRSCLHRSRTPLIAIALFAAMLIAALGMAALTPSSAHAATTEKTWVITSVKYASYAPASTRKTTYTYNAKGLMNKEKIVTVYGSNDPSTQITTYTYTPKNRLKSMTVAANGTKNITGTFKYDSAGRVVGATRTYLTNGLSTTRTYSYNAAGQLIKDAAMLGVSKYTYDNAGRIKKIVENSDETGKSVLTFAYDDRNNVTKLTQDGSYVSSFKLTYKNERLAKVVLFGNGGNKESVTTYTYKEIAVPKKAKAMVQSQQEKLIRYTGYTPSFETAHK